MIKSIAIIGFIFLCSCTRLQNSVEQVSLTCGENAGDGKRLIQLTGWDKDSFLVVAIPLDSSANLPNYSQRYTPRVTSKQCIEVDTNFSGILAVRDSTRGESFNINPGDLSLTQSHSQSLPNNAEIKLCPSQQFHTKEAISLQSQNKRFPSPVMPYYSVDIIDPLGNLKSHVINQTTVKIDFVTEGNYRLTVNTLDAFNGDSRQTISSDTCQVTYDKKPPTISSDIDRFPVSSQTGVILLLQENSFKLSGTDDNEVQFFTCLKKRSFPSNIDACDIVDFRLTNPFIKAPDTGVWDLQAFTQDPAGNQSEVLKISFAVYHDKDISRLDGIERRIHESLRKASFKEAGDAFRRALTAYEKFELPEEKSILQSPLLSAASDIQLLNTVNIHKEWQSHSGAITRSSLGQHIAIHGEVNFRLSVWDRKLNQILTRSNVTGFVWLSESALILDLDGSLYRYMPDEQLELIGTVPDIGFVSNRYQRRIEIVPDPKNSRRFALIGHLGGRIYEIDRDQKFQLLSTWDDTERNIEVHFSHTSDDIAFKNRSSLTVTDLTARKTKYPPVSDTGEVCRVKSFQFLPAGEIIVSHEDPSVSCPALALVREVGGQYTIENFLEKFDLTFRFQGPADLKAVSSGPDSLILAYQKETSRALQYFSLSNAGELKLLSTGVLETDSAEPIQNIEFDPFTRMIMLSKPSAFGFLAWDHNLRLPGDALWVQRYGSFSAALSNPIQTVEISSKDIRLHDIEQSFLGTRYLPSGEFLTRYAGDPSLQFMTLTPAIDKSSGRILTFDIPTLKLRVSDLNLRPTQELNLTFIPTALDTFKGEFYLAAADGKIYQYKPDVGNIIEIADFKSPVIQFEKFDEGFIAKVADTDGKNYSINRILQGQPIQTIWKRAGSGTFFSTEDRRLYHVNFGNRYVHKAPGFEKIFSSNAGMTKQTLFDKKSGDLYLLTDTMVVKYSKSNNYAEPGLRLSGGDSIYASSIGLLKLANKKLSVLPESTNYNENLLEDIEQVRTIDETHILVERTDGKVFVYNYRERKIAFYLEALTSGLKGVRCLPMGSSFLLTREMTPSISRIDRVPLDLEEVLTSFQ